MDSFKYNLLIFSTTFWGNVCDSFQKKNTHTRRLSKIIPFVTVSFQTDKLIEALDSVADVIKQQK